MRYMFLLYSAPDAGPADGTPEAAAEMQEWFAYTQAMVEAGVMIAGDPLHPVTSATTITTGDGGTVTTDGPFAETKEVLGGYYIVDVPDLDAALAWGTKAPTARYGSVEVRPVVDLSTLGAPAGA
ncbi:MAG: YciI family protein [Kineosporiaceae bacterium]|nr:YciI family protein [Kineosporiaceae bacterium]MBK7622656.1 YciI family protein [Kineosporiaceae bacterium]MBK8078635.1 YciI family protein [Kineosporiaceae bacterium]